MIDNFKSFGEKIRKECQKIPIKSLREKYSNIGKAKLYRMLNPWCKANGLSLPSKSAIGRVIAKDKVK